MAEAEVTKQVSPEMNQKATQKARDRAKAARWDLDVAVFFFAILATNTSFPTLVLKSISAILAPIKGNLYSYSNPPSLTSPEVIL